MYELNKLNVSHDTKHESKQSLFKYSEEEGLKKWKARKLLQDFKREMVNQQPHQEVSTQLYDQYLYIWNNINQD